MNELDWFFNSDGDIENSDYITSSDYLGYGQKQDDDFFIPLTWYNPSLY